MKKNKIGIVYHRVDFDGFASCAIVRQYLLENWEKLEDIVLIPMNYGDPYPKEKLEGLDVLYIVDFSFSYDDFINLMDIEEIYWFDHHESTYKELEKVKFIKNLPGKRSNDQAAIGLVWEYFYPKKSLPLPLQLLNDYDIWKKDGKHSWEKILTFQTGMKYFTDDFDPMNHESIDNWSSICLFNPIFQIGKIVLEEKRREYKMDKKRSFLAVSKDYHFICINSPYKTSELLGEDLDKYDFAAIFTIDGLDQVNVSLRSSKEGIHCGLIAAQHNGGGHKGAAGFRCTVEEFKKFIGIEV